MYSQNELDIAILPLSDSSIILGNPIYRKTFTHSCYKFNYKLVISAYCFTSFESVNSVIEAAFYGVLNICIDYIFI